MLRFGRILAIWGCAFGVKEGVSGIMRRDGPGITSRDYDAIETTRGGMGWEADQRVRLGVGLSLQVYLELGPAVDNQGALLANLQVMCRTWSAQRLAKELGEGKNLRQS